MDSVSQFFLLRYVVGYLSVHYSTLVQKRLKMSAKAIREYHGKKLAARHINRMGHGTFNLEDRIVLISTSELTVGSAHWDEIAMDNPWVQTTKLVVKPDQLIKRRGKAGLLGINLTWPQAVSWIEERMNKECKVEVVSGILDHFIVEPFVPHAQSEEYYICIQVCSHLYVLTVHLIYN